MIETGEGDGSYRDLLVIDFAQLKPANPVKSPYAAEVWNAVRRDHVRSSETLDGMASIEPFARKVKDILLHSA